MKDLEYVTDDAARDRVRATAIPLLRKLVERLAGLAELAYAGLAR